jgi:hypothetical protein
MSERDDVRLPRSAEAILGDWPAPERDEAFWEASAVATMLRAEQADAASTDALLHAPLPPEPGEPGAQDAVRLARPAAPASAGMSLAELARQSLADEAAANQAREIAEESLSIASRARESIPEIAAAVRASRPPAPPAGGPEVRADEPRPSPAAPRRHSRLAPVAGVGAALLGIAAAVALYLRTDPVPEAQQPAPVVVAPAPTAAAERPAAEEPKDDGTSRVSDLAREAEGASTDDSKVAAPARGGAAPAKGSPAAEAAAETEPEAPEGERVALTEEDREAERLAPAARGDDLPLEPGKGAVQAAVGSVLGGARACVAGHDAPSRATVVFGSNGRVQSVTVSGPAAGTPAEDCIRSALSQARVQPFAKSTYAAGFPVRPN